MNQQKSQVFLDKYKNKKVLIMGLGLHGGGVGAAEFFAKAGAKVTATDLRTKEQLKESIEKLKKWPIKYVLRKHREEDFKKADLIIRNPAVPDDSPYLETARRHNVPIDTDIGIFFEALMNSPSPPQIIGTTGTRGKSTTATLIFEFLRTKYKNVVLAGNIRKSVLSELSKIKNIFAASPPQLRRMGGGVAENLARPFVVLELSSWQLEGLAQHKKSPHIAVITIIQPDHLNRHKGMGDYIKAKKLIYKFQNKNDFLFLNKGDKIVKNFAKKAKAKSVFYEANEARKYKTNLMGEHNLANIAAAIKVVKYFKISDAQIKKTLKKFKGLEGRLQKIGEIKGIKFINDTCATTPDATIAAINAVSSHFSLISNHLILIAGGADKNLDFGELAKVIAKKVKMVILLKGAATERLKKSIISAFKQKPHPNPPLGKGRDVVLSDSMHKAVKMAYNIAKKGDVILLSPACASFGMFRHEFERGSAFVNAVLSSK